MADKTVTVRPSGGTYTSLQAAITGEVTANANLTAGGMNGILTISIEGDWSGGADTTAVDVSGFTTDSTHYVNIVTDSANKAGTSWDTSKYRLSGNINSGDWTQLVLNNSYTRVTGLQINNTAETFGRCVRVGEDNCSIINCLSKSAEVIYAQTGSTCNWINDIALGGTIGFDTGTDDFICYNCVAVNYSEYGFYGSQFVAKIYKNCYAGSSVGTSFYQTSGVDTVTTCRTSDGAYSTTVVALSTSTFTSVTAGSENLSLVSGSALIGVGTDLRADGTYPFDYDIVGTTRGATWDVGAFEFAVSNVFSQTGSGTITLSGSATVSYTSNILPPRGRLSSQPDNSVWPSYYRNPRFNVWPLSSNLRHAPADQLSGDYETEILQWGFFGPQASAVSNVFSQTGSGTITLSGSATYSVIDSYVGSGTLNLTGAGTCSQVTSVYSYIASGNLTLSGSASYTIIKSYAGSGNLNLTGSAEYTFSESYTASGNLTLSGAATYSFLKNYTASGTLSLSGGASTSVIDSYVGSGALSLSGAASTSFLVSYTGSGNLNLSGAASCNFTGAKDFYQTGSGTISLSGNASTQVIDSYAGSGSLTLSGAATRSFSLSYAGSGNLNLTGTAVSKQVYSFTGSGNLNLSGTATCAYVQTVFAYSGSGNLTLAGSATCSQITSVYSYTASGALILSGNASYKSIISYSGSGNLTLSGAATTSSSGGGTYVYAITFYNGIQLACEYPATSSDIRFKSGGKTIGVPVIASSNNHAGSVRIKVNGNVKALKIL